VVSDSLHSNQNMKRKGHRRNLLLKLYIDRGRSGRWICNGITVCGIWGI